MIIWDVLKRSSEVGNYENSNFIGRVEIEPLEAGAGEGAGGLDEPSEYILEREGMEGGEGRVPVLDLGKLKKVRDGVDWVSNPSTQWSDYKSDFNYYNTVEHMSKPKISLRYYASFGADSTESGQSLVMLEDNSLVSFNKAHAWKLNLNSRKQTVFLIHQSPLTAIGKHPYETIVATSDNKSNICIWDTSGFILLKKFQSKIPNGALSLQFNPNGSKLAAVFFDSSYVLG